MFRIINIYYICDSEFHFISLLFSIMNMILAKQNTGERVSIEKIESIIVFAVLLKLIPPKKYRIMSYSVEGMHLALNAIPDTTQFNL